MKRSWQRKEGGKSCISRPRGDAIMMFVLFLHTAFDCVVKTQVRLFVFTGHPAGKIPTTS